MKKTITVLASILLLFAFAGCNNKQNSEELGKCPIEMQSVSNNDSDTKEIYNFLIPKGWISQSPVGHTIEAISPDSINSQNLDKDISLSITIRNYSDNKSSKDIQQYKDLFEGKTDEYKQTIIKHFQEVGGTASNFQYVVGGFDNTKKFSSGEVVPWVADSLQISGTKK